MEHRAEKDEMGSKNGRENIFPVHGAGEGGVKRWEKREKSLNVVCCKQRNKMFIFIFNSNMTIFFPNLDLSLHNRHLFSVSLSTFDIF